MADKKKEDFLKDTISKDLKEAEIAVLSKTLDVKESFTTEINPEQRMKKVKTKKWFKLKLLLWIVGILILFMIIGSVFVYFYYVAPFWASKPYMEKIELTDTLAEDHISYIINEIGGYKLHDAPLGGTQAQMELYIVDTMRKYTITVQDRVSKTFVGDASDPDLRINVEERTIINLYNSEDIVAETKRLVDTGSINIEALKDESVLASKGYKPIYDQISGQKISGRSLLKMSSGIKKIFYFFAVMIIFFIGAWYLWKTRS
ncbi:hypothetical protein KY326_04595 [Candidatus Woesearchaeota archaeon]|nr:hypothetical protein [Candidatus Woesearchaeota archaeon]